MFLAPRRKDKEAAAAQTYLEEGKQFGKVVLRIPD